MYVCVVYSVCTSRHVNFARKHVCTHMHVMSLHEYRNNSARKLSVAAVGQGTHTLSMLCTYIYSQQLLQIPAQRHSSEELLHAAKLGQYACFVQALCVHILSPHSPMHTGTGTIYMTYTK
jgi:hypothetical protein